MGHDAHPRSVDVSSDAADPDDQLWCRSVFRARLLYANRRAGPHLAANITQRSHTVVRSLRDHRKPFADGRWCSSLAVSLNELDACHDR